MLWCRVKNDDLTTLIYDAFAALEKEDWDTAYQKYKDAKPLYSDALSKCGKVVTDPIEQWGKKLDDLVDRIGWTEMSQKIYNENKDEID